jgi:hypothetical protein
MSGMKIAFRTNKVLFCPLQNIVRREKEREMETIVYRKAPEALSTGGNHSNSVRPSMGETIWAESPGERAELQPEIFYPPMSDTEKAVWEHWLPTTFIYHRASHEFPSEVVSALTRLKAPQEILEEFTWACKTEFFDSYELKTPQRRDLRDPLLVGRRGGKRYRIALWGESLRPFEEIVAVVEESLALRARTAWWHHRIVAGGTLLGLGLGLWLGSQASFEGDAIGALILFTLLGFSFTWLCSQVYTPENRQQTFLDRYRS